MSATLRLPRLAETREAHESPVGRSRRGVIPLMLASGAGAASRQSIGTTVFGGMLGATILSLALVPVFYKR